MCKSTPYIIRLLDMHEAFQTLCHIQMHTQGKQLEYVNIKGERELDEILNDASNLSKGLQ